MVVPGFAILALCCLLAEALQGFRDKPAKPKAPSGPCTFQDDGKCIKPTTVCWRLIWHFYVELGVSIDRHCNTNAL